MFDVFLSHNSHDKPLIRDLRDRLRAAGMTTWLDEDNLPAGRPWIDGIEEGLKQSRVIIVAFGADDLGPWETPEMRAALIEMVRRKAPVIPLLLPGCSDQVELPLFLQTLTWIDCRNGIGDTQIQRIREAATGQPAIGTRAVSRPVTPKPTQAKGLDKFTEFGWSIAKSVGVAGKVGVALPILLVAIGLEPPWDSETLIESKITVVGLTLLVQVLAITAVFVLLKKKTPAELRTWFKASLALAAVSLVVYVICFLLFTELQPDTRTRLIAGWKHSEQYEKVLQFNTGNHAATKMDFGYDPMRIYTPASVWGAFILVVMSWMFFFGSFVFYLGSFVHSIDDSAQMDDRSLVVLQLPESALTALRMQRVETVGDLCALSMRQLKLVLTGQDLTDTLAALKSYGIDLRSAN